MADVKSCLWIMHRLCWMWVICPYGVVCGECVQKKKQWLLLDAFGNGWIFLNIWLFGCMPNGTVTRKPKKITQICILNCLAPINRLQMLCTPFIVKDCICILHHIWHMSDGTPNPDATKRNKSWTRSTHLKPRASLSPSIFSLAYTHTHNRNLLIRVFLPDQRQQHQTQKKKQIVCIFYVWQRTPPAHCC